MKNPLFSRHRSLAAPIVPLNKNQLRALQGFRERLDQGFYQFEHVSCLCGRHDGTLVASRDRYALPVSTHLCKRCGLMWTSPRMTVESLAAFYDLDYRPVYVGCEQAPEEFFTDQVQRGRSIYDFVAAHFPASGGHTVFDVGCGAGGVLVPFVAAGWRAFGCDLDGQYLLRGRAEGLELEQGDVSVLQKHGQADLVILSHVLEHLSDPRKSLQQISSLTGDSARLYVELPGILSIHKTYGDFLVFLQNAHLYHFTLRTLSSLMVEEGFVLEEGNENIRAIYRKDGSVMQVDTSDQCRRIMQYLTFLELGRVTRLWQARSVAAGLLYEVKGGFGR
jgi:SAM-dependent methyltransferase